MTQNAITSSTSSTSSGTRWQGLTEPRPVPRPPLRGGDVGTRSGGGACSWAYSGRGWLHRCSNPECRLYGVRVWLEAGTDYTCECGDPATLSRTAREHLAAAREALRTQGAKA